MWHHDLRYGTMCNLRYVDKVADKVAVPFDSKPFFGSFSATLFERKSSLRSELTL